MSTFRRRRNFRRTPISQATRHDVSVAVVNEDDGRTIGHHNFVELDKDTAGTFFITEQPQRCPRVKQVPNHRGMNDSDPRAPGTKLFGVTVTDAKTYEGRRVRKGEIPVCVVSVAGPVTAHIDWFSNDPNNIQRTKYQLSTQYVGNRGLAIYDGHHAAQSIDLILYDSWERADSKTMIAQDRPSP